MYWVGEHKADGPVCSPPVHGLDPCFVTVPLYCIYSPVFVTMQGPCPSAGRLQVVFGA
jgi:hypothetical protein